jgi:short-subunit dehydrogenase
MLRGVDRRRPSVRGAPAGRSAEGAAMQSLKGRTALVTGASSGIGAAFARELAALGADLVVTARRRENLEALAGELRAQHGVQVDVLALDLSQPGAAKVLHERTEGEGRAIDVLINNAGGGLHQRFADIPWEKTAAQLQLNVVALTEATHLFVRPMLARGRGHILNVSSVGAYSPTPFYATYAAGKAYVRDFTEALAYELRDTPVRVTSLCPGATRTEFQRVAGQEDSGLVAMTYMSADECARIGLRALFGGRRNVISGLVNKLGMFFLRFLPRRTIVWGAAMTMGPPTTAPTPQLAAAVGERDGSAGADRSPPR